MAADTNLVNLSLKESISRNSNLDLKPKYDSSLGAIKTFASFAETAIGNYKKNEDALALGREKQLDKFEVIMQQNYDKIMEKGESMPQEVVAAVDDELKRLTELFKEHNTYGKNDTVENERMRTYLTSELKKITNQVIEARTLFGILGKDTRSWNKEDIKGDLAAMNKMFDLDNMDVDDGVSTYFKNGKLTFRSVGHLEDGGGDVSYNLRQMRNNIPQTNPDLDAELVEIFNSQELQAKTRGKNNEESDYNERQIKGDILNKIQTNDDFRNFATRRVADINEKSFRSHLRESREIAVELLNIRQKARFEHLDTKGNNDGIIDARDLEDLSPEEQQAFNNDFNLIISALTNIDDDNFSLETSKNLLADYFTTFVGAKYNTSYNAALPEDVKEGLGAGVSKGNYILGKGELYNPAGGKGFFNPGWKYSKGRSRFDDITASKKIQKGEEVQDISGNIYKPTMDTSKLTGMSDFGNQGYNVIDSATGKLIKYSDAHKEDGIGSADQNGNLFYTLDQAQRNVTGLTQKKLK